MDKPVREIRIQTDTGATLRVFSNDLHAPASDIAALYKRRWAIELFFRWVKQTLKIKHFLGTSENAVRIQIIVALIAFLLIRLAHETHAIIASALAFARLIKTNLMQRRNIADLLERPTKPTSDQYAFCFETLAKADPSRRRPLHPTSDHNTRRIKCAA